MFFSEIYWLIIVNKCHENSLFCATNSLNLRLLIDLLTTSSNPAEFTFYFLCDKRQEDLVALVGDNLSRPLSTWRDI